VKALTLEEFDLYAHGVDEMIKAREA